MNKNVLLNPENKRKFVLRIFNAIASRYDLLNHILSLGNQYLVDFLEEEEVSFVAPLDLVLCERDNNGCGLLQLHHPVSPDLLYRRFWYKSGVNQTIRNDLEEIVHKSEEKFLNITKL